MEIYNFWLYLERISFLCHYRQKPRQWRPSWIGRNFFMTLIRLQSRKIHGKLCKINSFRLWCCQRYHWRKTLNMVFYTHIHIIYKYYYNMVGVAVAMVISTTHEKSCIDSHNAKKFKKKFQNSVIHTSRNHSDEIAKVSQSWISLVIILIRCNYSESHFLQNLARILIWIIIVSLKTIDK